MKPLKISIEKIKNGYLFFSGRNHTYYGADEALFFPKLEDVVKHLENTYIAIDKEVEKIRAQK